MVGLGLILSSPLFLFCLLFPYYLLSNVVSSPMRLSANTKVRHGFLHIITTFPYFFP